MKGQKNKIVTQSTIAYSKKDFSSNSQIPSPSFYNTFHLNKERNIQRTVSILDTMTYQDQATHQNIYQNINLTKPKISNNLKNFQNCNTDTKYNIFASLSKIFMKKKRYSFQIIKQFFIFPDQTQSSITSISSYDPLIFQDQVIHTLIKILQTKSIQNKIWGFINLKMMPFFKAAIKIQQKATDIYVKTAQFYKKNSFNTIKKVSEQKFQILINQRRLLQTNIDSFIESQKSENQFIESQIKRPRILLNSNIIQEKIRPQIRLKYENNSIVKSSVTTCVSESPRILTTEEYMKKYKLTSENNQNLRPKVIRISATEYYNKPQQRKTQINTQVFTSRTQSLKNQQSIQKSKINKYNIIHYHQRPRQIFCQNYHSRIKSCCNYQLLCENQFYNKMCHQAYIYCQTRHCKSVYQQQLCSKQTKFNNKCKYCSDCETCYQQYANKSKYCNNQSLIQNTCCSQKSRKENDIKINSPKIIGKIDGLKARTTSIQLNEKKIIESKKGDVKTTQLYDSGMFPNYELSQLSSRIEYLNFLRKVVKEQEEQQVNKSSKIMN